MFVEIEREELIGGYFRESFGRFCRLEVDEDIEGYKIEDVFLGFELVVWVEGKIGNRGLRRNGEVWWGLYY